MKKTKLKTKASILNPTPNQMANTVIEVLAWMNVRHPNPAAIVTTLSAALNFYSIKLARAGYKAEVIAECQELGQQAALAMLSRSEKASPDSPKEVLESPIAINSRGETAAEESSQIII